MNGQPILMILLFLGFVVEVVTSATVLMFGSLLLSVTYMLVAIFVLFVAYERLRDSLEERLGASQ
jgi:hypothetical protein